jgi:Zn-finger nucleic acid-binding protein
MQCAACGHELPSGFPGATVTCVCGVSTEIEAGARSSHGPASSLAPAQQAHGHGSGGPYREPSSMSGDSLRETTCPYCGNGCPPMVRVCPHCDVRLDNVRCVRCYSLQPPGSFACDRCGQALELEPLLDATDAPCPRCMKPLEATGGGDATAIHGIVQDARVHECPRCGGMFVPRDALADILCRAELNGPFPEIGRPTVALDQVKYVPCPLCHTSMNRVNFGKVSGVIVDVCRPHGTWFDGGELTRVVAFAASGGLAKTRAREQQEKKQLAATARQVHAELVGLERRGHEPNERLEMWRDFLHSVFRW